MPQALIIFVAEAAALFIAVVGAVVGEAAALFILDIGIKFAGLALLGNLAKRLIDIPDIQQTAKNNVITVRGTLEHQRIIYGESLFSGPLWYMNTAGTHNQELYHAIIVAGHEIEDITDVWFDDEIIPEASIDWAGNGSVDSGWLAGDTALQTTTFLDKFLGGSGQVASPDLISRFTEINSSHIGAGIAWFLARTDFFEGQTEVWSKGVPRNFKALVKGKKVYNPNSDDTQSWGTGPHRLATPSTWEWSDNSALCWADYMIDAELGFGEDSSRINYAYVASVTAINSEVVFTPVGTDHRFSCNGGLSTGTSHKGNLESILSSANMTMALVQGEWKLRGWEFETPTLSFGDDELRADISIQLSTKETERYNTVRGSFIDRDRRYQASQFPAFTSSEYVARDNSETLFSDIQLPMTTDVYMAQRLAAGILEQSDLQRVVIYPSNFKTLPVEIGGTVMLSNTKLGWVNDTFRVTNYKLNDMRGIDLVLKEDNSAAYTPVSTDEYTVSSGGVYSPAAPGVPPTTSFTAVSIASGIRLKWTNPAARLFDFIDVYESATDQWSGRTLIASIRTDLLDVTYDSGTTRFFWTQARNFTNELSDRNPDSDTSTITATSGRGADGLTSVPDFTPGHIGGTSDFVYSLNTRFGGASNDGEIRIEGTTFEHPDGTTITTDVADFDLLTFYEGPTVGKFYINFSATVAETRFGGASTDWGGGDDTRFHVAVWDETNLWRARDNSGTFFSMTVVATDCIIAVCEKVQTVDGIETIVPFTSGLVGNTGAAGSGGADSRGVLVNGGFETGDNTGWGVGPTGIIINDGTARTGTYYMRLASGGGGPNHTSDRYAAPAVGREIRISGFARRDASDLPDNDTSIAGRFWDSSDVQVGARLSIGTADKDVADWQTLDGVLVVPATAVTFSVDCGETSGVGAWEFDDLTAIVEGNAGIDAITGFVEPENGLAWVRATTGGAWTPTQLTTDLDVTFKLGNTIVAKIARRITLTDATGVLNITSTTHKDSDLNTSRVTVSTTGAGTTAIGVQFDYSFSGDEGSDSVTVASAQGGDDGVLHYLTNEAHVIPANADGGGYDTSFTGAGGTHKLFEGVTDETTNATHTVQGGATKNGLTIAVISGTGVYSLSGTAWTTDLETFTLRAVFNSVNYEKTYTIAKAKKGADGGCDTDTLTNISLADEGVNPTATVGFRMDNNGDIFTRPNNPAGYTSKETWKGACVNSAYEGIYNHSGDSLTGGSASVDTWHRLNTDRTFELETSGAAKSTGGTIQIRRASDSVVLSTAAVSMAVETNA